MSDLGARPWWADVQHLRPAEDREREERARHARDAALEEVREATGVTHRAGASATPASAASRARGRFSRAAEALGGVALLDRDDARPTTFDAELASWLDDAPAPREREIELVVDEPLPVEGASAAPRRERFTTDDWLALTAPPAERRDPDTGRRVVEIRGTADGMRGVARTDDHDRATGGPTTARAAAAAGRRQAPRTSIERLYGRPDRVAMWAFVLGMVLILVALLGAPDAGAAI